jgi:hypothetical protein
MIMATISENLQILKDSTDAIKQAIIDKGGTISGDITTWASAINGISGGGSDNTKPEIAFFSFYNQGKYAYEVGMTWEEWINSEYGKMRLHNNHGEITQDNTGSIVQVFVEGIGTAKLRMEGNNEDIMLSTVINKDIINYTYYINYEEVY